MEEETNSPSLSAVKTLHQTIIQLRKALEESRSEIKQLKCKNTTFHRKNVQNSTKIRIKSKSLDSILTINKSTNVNSRNKSLKIKKTISFNKMTSEENRPPTEEDEEVDDIELIFTTDETKEDDFQKEPLVSIDPIGPSEEKNLTLQTGELNLSEQCELDDDVFSTADIPPLLGIHKDTPPQLVMPSSSSSTSNIFNNSSYYLNSSMEKDESFDHFEQHHQIIETDISKIGIQQDGEEEYCGLRRNTCPNPLQYRPISHREMLVKARQQIRPILGTNLSIFKCESGAQTDITALPSTSSLWLSESNLMAKAIGNPTSLPSKLMVPFVSNRAAKLKLSDKTVEARRVLLSDIGFTSMVPELSRSADHLFNQQQQSRTDCPQQQTAINSTYSQYLKTDEESCNFQPHHRQKTPSNSESIYLVPPSSRRCSAPVSPLSKRHTLLAHHKTKVRFANNSLPELRTSPMSYYGYWDSGDSTDSLVEEAENYLRRSIDCILTSKHLHDGNKKTTRRASAPEPSGDNVPPPGWQPFLPRVPRDLKLDHWVKVITPEGRVRGGRVRYIGIVLNEKKEEQDEVFVGVQLGSPDGSTDGVYGQRRYFQCEPYHGIFVPFKKVIMGWRP